MSKLTIALLVGDIRDVYSNALCKGAMRAAQNCDCNLLIVPGRYFHINEEVLYGEFQYQFQTLFSYFKENNVDVIISCSSVVGMSSLSDSRNSFDKYLKQWARTKVITVSGDNKDIPNICYENSNGLKDGVNYMIRKQKCKNIAMVAGPADNSDSIERVNAYKEALEENGIKVNEKLIVHSCFTEKSVDDVYFLLKGNKNIDGIVFANDRMAIGGYEAIKQFRDKEIGKNIAFLGFDNLEKDINLDPPLASVSADPEWLGYEAVEMAVEYMDYPDSKIEDRVLDTKFVMRESVLLGDDDEIVKASQEFSIEPQSDFDTYAKKTFNFIYQPSVVSNTVNKEKLYRKYLFFILEVERLFKSLNINKEDAKSLYKYFNAFMEEDVYCEIEITRLSMVVENIKNGIVANSQNKEKENLVVYISSLMYKRLSSYRALQDSERAYKLKQLQHDIYRISADMIGFSEANEATYSSLISKFKTIGIDHSFLYLFKEPIKNEPADVFQVDEFMYLKAYQRYEEVFSPEDRQQMIPVSEMFKHAFSIMNDESNYLVMLNLYVKNLLYGVLLCDIKYDNFMSYESLIYQLSSSLRIFNLLKVNQDTNTELADSMKVIEANNLRLDNLSKIDELTGVNNRRGFIEKANKMLTQQYNGLIQRPKYIVVGFADTDNLKYINDNYGHDEGDRVIVDTSRVLEKVFEKKNGAYGRMGGDEFAIITSTSKPYDTEKFMAEIDEEIEKINSTGNRKYKLSISVGFQMYEYIEGMDINQLLNEADKEMYHIKKKRHGRI